MRAGRDIGSARAGRLKPPRCTSLPGCYRQGQRSFRLRGERCDGRAAVGLQPTLLRGQRDPPARVWRGACGVRRAGAFWGRGERREARGSTAPFRSRKFFFSLLFFFFFFFLFPLISVTSTSLYRATITMPAPMTAPSPVPRCVVAGQAARPWSRRLCRDSTHLLSPCARHQVPRKSFEERLLARRREYREKFAEHAEQPQPLVRFWGAPAPRLPCSLVAAHTSALPRSIFAA